MCGGCGKNTFLVKCMCHFFMEGARFGEIYVFFLGCGKCSFCGRCKIWYGSCFFVCGGCSIGGWRNSCVLFVAGEAIVAMRNGCTSGACKYPPRRGKLWFAFSG